MIRILSAACMAAVLLFSMAAYGQETGKKKCEKPKSANELKTGGDLKKGLIDWTKYRECEIKELEDFVKVKGGYIAELREKIKKIKGNSEKQREDYNTKVAEHNELVAAYNIELPKLSLAANEATKGYNEVVAKYNQTK